jgi:hypothetical protein
MFLLNRRVNSRAIASLLSVTLGCFLFFRWECDRYDTFADYGAPRDSITIHHGNSVAHNIAVQTIDPWPPHATKSRIDVDGQRLMIGMERYKANKSLPPRGTSTESNGNGVSTNGK